MNINRRSALIGAGGLVAGGIAGGIVGATLTREVESMARYPHRGQSNETGIRYEAHETLDSATGFQPLTKVDIPAGGTVQLRRVAMHFLHGSSDQTLIKLRAKQAGEMDKIGAATGGRFVMEAADGIPVHEFENGTDTTQQLVFGLSIQNVLRSITLNVVIDGVLLQ